MRAILSSYMTAFGRLNIVSDNRLCIVASFWDDNIPLFLGKERSIIIDNCDINNGWYKMLKSVMHGCEPEELPPYRLTGTAFQKEVWKAAMSIARGEVKTYGEIARMVGRQKAYRAVAQALAANPLGIFVPCHRVVAADGIGGFNGGVSRKAALLRHELEESECRRLGIYKEKV